MKRRNQSRWNTGLPLVEPYRDLRRAQIRDRVSKLGLVEQAELVRSLAEHLGRDTVPFGIDRLAVKIWFTVGGVDPL